MTVFEGIMYVKNLKKKPCLRVIIYLGDVTRTNLGRKGWKLGRDVTFPHNIVSKMKSCRSLLSLIETDIFLVFSHCPDHAWKTRAEKFNPAKKSIFVEPQGEGQTGVQDTNDDESAGGSDDDDDDDSPVSGGEVVGDREKNGVNEMSAEAVPGAQALEGSLDVGLELAEQLEGLCVPTGRAESAAPDPSVAYSTHSPPQPYITFLPTQPSHSSPMVHCMQSPLPLDHGSDSDFPQLQGEEEEEEEEEEEDVAYLNADDVDAASLNSNNNNNNPSSSQPEQDLEAPSGGNSGGASDPAL